MNVEKLSEQLNRTASAAPHRTVDLDAVVAGATRIRRRRRMAAFAAGLVIVTAGATTGVLTLSDGRDSGSTIAPRPLPSPSSTPTPTTAPAPQPGPTQSPSAVPPLAIVPAGAPGALPPYWSAASRRPNAYFMSKAVVGNAIAYWASDRGDDAGHNYSSEGAVFDVASRTWSLMPVSPIAGRFGAAAAGSDHLFFVWGGDAQPPGGRPASDGATYDVLTKTWRTVARGPLTGGVPLGGVWDGQRFVVVTQQGSAAYDPQTDTWTELPSLPTAQPEASVVQVGSRTYVLSASSYYLERGASAWAAMPSPTNGASGPGGQANTSTLTGATDGATLVAAALTYGGALLFSTYDSANATWTALPPSPVAEANCYPPLAVTARNIFVACGSTGLFDRLTRTWTAYEQPIQVSDVASGVGSSIVVDGNPTLIYSPP